MQVASKDLTNQELLSALTEQLSIITDNMATKKDLAELQADIEARFATKDELHQMELRLTRKLDSHKAINIQHHITTRKMIGDLNSQFRRLREGLIAAATDSA